MSVGIVAFYSLIHLPREHVGPVLGGFFQVLQPGGRVLVSFHIGEQTQHVEELWGHEVNLDFVFFQTAEMTGLLEGAGFVICSAVERAPYPEVEVQTRRAYISASRP